MLIGLTGRAQSGKDTAYGCMEDMYGGRRHVERRAFADLLYQSAAAALGTTPNLLRELKVEDDAEVIIRDANKVRARVSVRRYLQRYGTEAHRDTFGSRFWVDAVDLTHGDRDLVVVTDVRFENEADAVREAGGHVVRVVGPPTPDDDHASEAPISDHLVDYILDNTFRDDGLGRLRRGIVQMMLDLTAREKWWTR